MPVQFLLEIRENKKKYDRVRAVGGRVTSNGHNVNKQNDEINQNATQSTNTGSLDWKQSKKQHKVPPLGSKHSSPSFGVSGIAEQWHFSQGWNSFGILYSSPFHTPEPWDPYGQKLEWSLLLRLKGELKDKIRIGRNMWSQGRQITKSSIRTYIVET